MKVLITGGTGSLGRALKRELLDAGHTARIMSRRPHTKPLQDGIEWAQADLSSGEGLSEAVAGVDAIIHAASDPLKTQEVDVGGTRHLVEAARASGTAHLLYISIVGIDDIPYSYYRRKLEAEGIIKRAGVPYSILRATQFHSLVGMLISKAARVPVVLWLPTDFKFQSVDHQEVARRLAQCVMDGPRGRVADFGGPEVLSLGEMARTWMELKGVRKRLIRLPLPGAVARAFRAGRNTAPEGERGVVGWREWLMRGT